MTIPSGWKSAADPAELFLLLWAVAAQWPPDRRVDAQMPSTEFCAALAASFRSEEAENAVSAACSAMEQIWPQDSTQYRDDIVGGIVLGTMRELDEIFLCIHPRAALVPTAVATRPHIPTWLEDIRDRRTLLGAYAIGEGSRLVPRGPFARGSRVPSDVNADTLADRFAALTAVPTISSLDETPISIEMRVIGQDILHGVPPNLQNVNREVVAIVPVAEIGSDLESKTFVRSGVTFLDVNIGKTLSPGERLASAIKALPNVDMVVSPELTMPEAELDILRKNLGGLDGPRLIISGSGASLSRDDKGRSWNQVVALNSVGRNLWHHQKVWPFEMASERAKECKIDDPGDGKTLKENIASGRAVTISDIEGFGRVIVLICQDIQMEPLVGQILRTYQPDWVVVPIMDPGIHKSRWIHSRTYDLSAQSRARFVVASSLSMAEWAEMDDPLDIPVGLFLGPRGTTATDPSTTIARAVALLSCDDRNPMRVKAQWNVGGAHWEQTTLGTQSAPLT